MGAHGMRALEDAAARLTLPPGAALRFSAVGEIAGDVAASLPPDLARAAPRRQAGFAAGRRAAARAVAAAGGGITAVGMGAGVSIKTRGPVCTVSACQLRANAICAALDAP